jgi:CDP-paratose 2-epimerase
MLEAITLSQQISGRELTWEYAEANRMGDHIWYISDLARFQADYPGWKLNYNVPAILTEIHQAIEERSAAATEVIA